MNYTIYSKDGCPYCDKIKKVMNKEDKHKFEENIEEEKRMSVERNVGQSGNKSLDLMKKLNDYLGNR